MAVVLDYEGYYVWEHGVVQGKRGNILQGTLNGKGYKILSLYIDGKVKTKAIHRMVAELFVPNPDNLPEVNHKDGNKMNNHKDNLEWTTRGGNIKHAYDTGLRDCKGTKNANVVLSEEEVNAICVLLENGVRQCKIRDMGYPYETVRAIKQRRQWVEISSKYIWS